jgi:hypothetical protein
MLFFRTSLLVLAFALAAAAQQSSEQQNSVKFMVYSTDFPKGCVIDIDLKLNYSVVDVNKMRNEGRNTPSANDYLLRQDSINSFDWNISYDNDGKPTIKKSPQSVVFNFKNPVNKLDNALSLIKIEGSGTLLNNGKTEKVPLVGQTHFFQPDTAYILMLRFIETKENGSVSYEAALITEQELQSLLNDKPEVKKFTGIVRPPVNR